MKAGPRATILYGADEVPVLRRAWKRNPRRLPYRKTYSLKPGQGWLDAPVTPDQWEHYVQLPEGPIPVGAAIARELEAEGALWAIFTECWGRGCVIMGSDLVCRPKEGSVGELLSRLHAANGNRWGGIPDVIAFFPDGRVAMREAKVAGKDKISSTQHAFARAAKALLGDKLDLAVVEWGTAVAPES